MSNSSSTKRWNDLVAHSPELKGNSITSTFIDAQAALISPVTLMLQIKDLMSESCSAKEKVKKILGLVRKEMRADVCSCFTTQPNSFLELYAASGLAADLVDKSRKLAFGEGIVGDIAIKAVPLNVPDASLHSSFISVAVMGNYDYKAFCGVPVLHRGSVQGVLVLQNKIRRNYGLEIIDFLQNVAMVLGELISSSTKADLNKTKEDAFGKRYAYTKGVSFSKGLARGNVVLHEPRLTMRNIIAGDTKYQKRRLYNEIENMQDAINHMINSDATMYMGETRDILEAYKMFAHDRGWLGRIETAIEGGLSAEAAVQRVLSEIRVRMMQVEDSYIRDRLQDIEDVSNRLLSHLMKQYQVKLHAALPESIVLVANSMGPASLLDYDREKLKAVVLEKGTSSSHLAIVARSMGIPVIGQCKDILSKVGFDDEIIVDANKARVYLKPSEQVVNFYAHKFKAKEISAVEDSPARNLQAITKDGIDITVDMNAGLISDISYIHSSGASGIGLFRTEISFMSWKKYPMVDEQTKLYKKILDRAGNKQVIFRTLDIGGDKPLSYFKSPAEENPAMGWRSVRIAMDRPAVLRTQLRAMIKAASGRDLKIMLPFVTEISEFDEAKNFLEMEKERAIRFGVEMPKSIELGVTLEVPSLIWQLDALLKKVDFISVGSNDLMQYLYASDRNNEIVRDRYDTLSPAMLSVLKIIAEKCNAAGVPLSICGEMAGMPLEAMVLIALGYRRFSVSRYDVDGIKMMVSSLEVSTLIPYLEKLMASDSSSLREKLLAFASDSDIKVASSI